MKIKLEKLDVENSKEVFDFEMENREYFETCLPPRSSSYYNIDEYNKIIESLIKEQNNSECYLYLIKNNREELVGRINLFLVNNIGKIVAELGYRIGKIHGGKGIATEAVKLLLEEDIKVNKIIAGTAEENIASQKVLEKNGFKFENKIENYIEINGKSINSINYLKLIK